MAKSFVQPGDVETYIAPTGGVVGGVGVMIGSKFVVALDTVAQTLPFRGMTSGTHSLAKVGSQAWTEGVAVYFDTTNKWMSSTATVGFFRVGTAVVATGAGAGETIGVVHLDNTATFAVSATYVQR
jgi:predicted RecA/RadA family phage recombinase